MTTAAIVVIASYKQASGNTRQLKAMLAEALKEGGSRDGETIGRFLSKKEKRESLVELMTTDESWAKAINMESTVSFSAFGYKLRFRGAPNVSSVSLRFS